VATSRTGTATHKRMRKLVLAQAIEQGLLNCPECGVALDFNVSRRPNSPEADEVTPYAVTGRTSTDLKDWQILCRRCNQSKGGKLGYEMRGTAKAVEPGGGKMPVSPGW
jgi:5-methylcytosine-specific restriction endonuclease McrA